MPKRIPEPTIKVSTPEYEISDNTAMIKAQRLMKELKAYGTAKNFAQKCAEVGFQEGLSPTRRWRATWAPGPTKRSNPSALPRAVRSTIPKVGTRRREPADVGFRQIYTRRTLT